MKFIHSVCIILGSVIGAIQSLPIPHNNNHNNNQIKIDLDPAIVITHPPASILYDINGVLANPKISEIEHAIVPPAPPPAPPGPILYEPLETPPESELGPVIMSPINLAEI
jgi:hypothetical protein